jgi:hypothetical protein
VHDLQGPVKPAERALGVGHYREVVIATGHPASGPQFREGLRPALGAVSRDADDLADDADAAG